MAKGVYVKDQGVVEFPDETDEQTMLRSLRRKFSNLGQSAIGAGEAALSIGSAALAEPVSGLAGLVGTALPGEEGQGAKFVQSVGDAMTYEPMTEKGVDYMRKVAEILQPVGEVIQGASQNLGDKAYSATGSPALAAAAYSAPTALLEGLGLKGFGIARNPVSGADIYTPKINSAKVEHLDDIDDVDAFIDFYKNYSNKIPEKLLHGTSGGHKELSPSYAGDVSAGAGEGLWLTDSRKYAWEYAQNAASKRGMPPKIIRFSTGDVKSPLVVEFSGDGTAILNGVRMPDIYDNAGVISIAKKIGADSVWFPDGSFTDEPSLVVFDGDKIKFLDEEVFE